MIRLVTFHIDALDSMKKYPAKLYAQGDLELLHREKIAIVGSRKPNQYAREMTHQLALKLSNAGVCIVSGGAIGVDAVAHKAAGASNTIMVAATGLERRYPAINKNLIADIERDGLVLSQFETGTPSTRYNFVLRNELVVALGNILIVTYADLNSGTMRSVEYAEKMGKKIYVLAHRAGESEATNLLLSQKRAEAIYDIDSFVKEFAAFERADQKEDEFLEYCKRSPSYEEALKKFPSRLFEAELGGEIVIKNARVFLV